ncbi:MAG: hypothetical protein ACOYKZ_00590 [Chlamydiia bacterium]
MPTPISSNSSHYAAGMAGLEQSRESQVSSHGSLSEVIEDEPPVACLKPRPRAGGHLEFFGWTREPIVWPLPGAAGRGAGPFLEVERGRFGRQSMQSACKVSEALEHLRIFGDSMPFLCERLDQLTRRSQEVRSSFLSEPRKDMQEIYVKSRIASRPGSGSDVQAPTDVVSVSSKEDAMRRMIELYNTYRERFEAFQAWVGSRQEWVLQLAPEEQRYWHEVQADTIIQECLEWSEKVERSLRQSLQTLCLMMPSAKLASAAVLKLEINSPPDVRRVVLQSLADALSGVPRSEPKSRPVDMLPDP